MKITGLEVQQFKPVPWPGFILKYAISPMRQFGLGKITTDEGVEGWIISSSGGLRDLVSRWRVAREYLEGRDPLDRGKIETLMQQRFEWPNSAIGVLDMALWDIAGKAMNQPVYKLLGACRDSIPAYGSTMHCETDQEQIDVALECKKKGFKAVKLHPYDVPEDDIRLYRAVREAVGDKMILMTDTRAYPGPYERSNAFKVGKVLDELNFYWFEDAMNSKDLEGLAELCRRVEVDVLMSERIRDAMEYVPMIQMKATDRLRGNLGQGGIMGVLKVAHLAEAHGMNCEVHSFTNMLEAASLHIMLAINNCEFFEQGAPEGIFDERIYPGLFKSVIRIDGNGYVHAPTRPGLGYDIDPEVAEKITVEKLKA